MYFRNILNKVQGHWVGIFVDHFVLGIFAAISSGASPGGF